MRRKLGAACGQAQQFTQRRSRDSDATAEPEHRRRPATRPYQLVRRRPADAKNCRRGHKVHHDRQLVQVLLIHHEAAPAASDSRLPRRLITQVSPATSASAALQCRDAATTAT